MKQSKFSEEQIISILREAEKGGRPSQPSVALTPSQRTPSTNGDSSTAAWRSPMPNTSESWRKRMRA
jgi:hypothetical protein